MPYIYIVLYIYCYIYCTLNVKKKKVLLRDTRDTQKKKKTAICDSPAKFYVLMSAEQEAPNIYSTKRGALNISTKDKVKTID